MLSRASRRRRQPLQNRAPRREASGDEVRINKNDVSSIHTIFIFIRLRARCPASAVACVACVVENDTRTRYVFSVILLDFIFLGGWVRQF